MTDKQYKESLIEKYEQTGINDFIIVDETYSLTRKDIKDKKREFKLKSMAATPIHEVALVDDK